MKLNIKIEPLPERSHWDYGGTDNAKRWYPDPEIQVPGSFNVRSPTRAFPYSNVKHYYTKKYAKLLFKHNPEAYLRMQGIPKDSPTHKEVLKYMFAMKVNPHIKVVYETAGEGETVREVFRDGA